MYRPTRAKLGAAIAATAALALLAVSSAPASAAPATPETDFRDAIAALPCGTGPYAIEITQNITFAIAGDPVYSCADALMISSTSGSHFTIDGSGVTDTRFLDASASTGYIEIVDLTITGFGKATTGASTDANGGALVTGGPVSVRTSTFSNNSVTTAGDSSNARGGAIYVGGSLDTTSATFTGNTADAGTGASASAAGGAIFATGSLTFTGSTFTGNHVTATGTGSAAKGGAATAGSTVTTTNGSASSNTATGAGGADGGAFYAAGAAHISGGSFDSNTASGTNESCGGALVAEGGGTVADAAFTSNDSATTNGTGYGGAVCAHLGTLTVSGSTFTGNSARMTVGTSGQSAGGAILSYGSVTVDTTTFSGNTSSATGTNVTSFAAAIATADSLVVRSSTLSANASVASGTSSSGARGGALYDQGTTLLFASTLTANSATASGALPTADGGGLYSSGASIASSTLVGNGATTGAQVWANSLSTFGSVYAGAPTGESNCVISAFKGTDGYNFDDDATCATTAGTDIGNGANPMVGALASNGGPTQTMAPLTGSPLVDVIPYADCSSFSYSYAGISAPNDQRGVTRADPCDVGAVEVLPNSTFDVVTPSGTIHGTVLNATGVSGAAFVSPSTLTPGSPTGVSLPFGTITFTVAVPQDGWSVTVILDLPHPVNQFWKYQNGAWTQVTGAVVSGTTVTYGLTDGGTGDADLTANSSIVDPAAPGIGASFTG